MAENLRYLQQSLRERITFDLTMTRIGELNIRDIDVLVRGLLYHLTASVEGVVFEGLVASPGSGLSVDLTNPAVVVQQIPGGDVKYCLDDNDGSVFSVVLATADGSNPRIDNIEARIQTRSKFTDNTVDIVDPVTQIVTTQSRDRDFEIFLNIQKIDGTPAGSPSAPSVTAATEGSITGSVTTDVLDLSTEYILNLAVGKDTEFVEIDMRGGTPASTTRVERLSAINSAGFGAVATDVGGAIKITGIGVLGQNSVVRIKQPVSSVTDAYAEVLGGTESDGYFDTFTGANPFFKIAEIFVPTSAASLTAGNVRSREEKSTWDAGAAALENGFNLDGHRKEDPIDHPDGSVTLVKIDPAAVTSIVIQANSRIALLDELFAFIYAISAADTVLRRGSILINLITEQLTKADGTTGLISDFEQASPRHRVDQRQDDITGATGYTVPAALIEDSPSGPNTFPFLQGTAVSDGTNDYTVQFDETKHSRLGIYIKNGGAVANFTHLRCELHKIDDTQLASFDIPIADLISVGTGWIYVDLVATLVDATNHYHFHMIGEAGATPPVLGEDTTNTNLSFRQFYLPTSGKFGGGSEADVLSLFNRDGTVLFAATTTDVITTPGTGFAGESSGTNHDFMTTDFSNITLWTDWEYEDYIGVDPVLGRVKFPVSGSKRSIDHYFKANINEPLNDTDAKNYDRHNQAETLEDYFTRVSDRFEGVAIEVLREVVASGISFGANQGMQSALFPDSGSPGIVFDYTAPQNKRNGSLSDQFSSIQRLRIRMYHSHTSTSGNAKLDITIKVRGSAGASSTKTIAVVATKGTDLFEDVVIGTELLSNVPMEITITRDNGVGSNMSGDFAINTIVII